MAFSTAQVLQVVSAIVAFVSLCWAIFATLRRGDVSRRTLRLIVGRTGASQNLIGHGETRTRRLPRSTLILTAPLRPSETGYFVIPLGVKNTATTAAKNVRLLLNYPAEHHIRDLEHLPKFRFDDAREVNLPVDTGRQSHEQERMTHVSYELGMLRPREGAMLAEPIQWACGTTHEVFGEDSETTHDLNGRLKAAGVAGYFILHAWVSAENCLPEANKFNILWLNDEFVAMSDSDREARIHKIVEAFWGEMPLPGIYLSPPWPFRKPMVRWEAAEILILETAGAQYRGKRFRIAEANRFGYGLIRMPMPPWNYHEESRPDLEALRSPLLSTIATWLRRL